MNTILPLFANPTLVKVLCLFFFNPEDSFYQAQIVAHTGKTLLQVQRSLKQISKAGLVSMIHQGRKIYYKAIRIHPAFEDLKRAFFRTLGMGDLLRQQMRICHKEAQLAWIFGSVARGEEKQSSDIDILFVSKLSLIELSELVGPVLETATREINPVILTPESLYKKWQEKDSFIQEIICQPKIWLIGNDHELNQLLGKTDFTSSTFFSRRN
ncbi:MAG TPA: nucleotidyltransferase domain-containing protein [Chlamydiales bacterium]|jgi:predicted nucleotidyltransferase